MPAQRTKQQRLVQPTLPRIANLRVVTKPLLSASTLANWLYCPTKPFLDRVLERLGLDRATPAMRAGARAHAEVQGALEAEAQPSDLSFPAALRQGAFLFASEFHLLDERRRLHGFVDLLYARAGQLHVLELKNTHAPIRPDARWGVPVWREHGVQLHFYGLLANSQFGSPPRLALGYLRGGSKEATLAELAESRDTEAALVRLTERSVHLPQGPAERAYILDEARRFRRAEREATIPAPDHVDAAKCSRCGTHDFCPFRMDRPGQFTALDGGLIDATADA